MSNPSKKHWDAIKLILRYLSGTKDKCPCLGRGDASIIGYIDSHYAECADSKKSTCWLEYYEGMLSVINS
jgi:hypothetical protein